MSLPSIIGLAGKAGVGKSTITQLINESTPKRSNTVKLAGPIYELQRVIYESLRLPQPVPKDRRLLQLIGTDWGRAIDNDFWVKRYYENTQVMLKNHDFVLTDDVRFNNEAQFIRANGGIILLIVGRGEIMSEQALAHESEAGISLNHVDFIVDNSGTIQDTRNQIVSLLEELNGKTNI